MSGSSGSSRSSVVADFFFLPFPVSLLRVGGAWP
jgi:hypothetical protein